ncbi:MAG: hypothetical protein KC425_07605 [Anaerolineales bacterium]|nr:hypothetical protein [Anaerolineales bacterium]
MTAIALDPAFLAEFEAGLNPLDPPGSAIPAQVLGYGEISTVLAIPDAPQPGLAFKRMPMFDSAAEAAAYEALYADWVDVVQGQIGVNVLPGRLYRLAGQNGRVVIYLVQPLLPPASIGHKALAHLPTAEVTRLLRAILAQFRQVFAFNAANAGVLEVGFDGQLSNWAIANFDAASSALPESIALRYLDTTSPLLRRGGQEQLDAELFLRSAPSFLVWIIRRLFLEDVVTRYYDLRKVTIDLLANLYKEQRPDLVPLLTSVANEALAGAPGFRPIRAADVRAYYREDAFIWRFYLAARRIDRRLHRLRARPYPYILPGRIQR